MSSDCGGATASKGDTIDRTNITVAQVERTLTSHIGTDATLQSWDYVEIGKGKGFLSCMVRMELVWSETSDDSLPQCVLVKIPDFANFKAVLASAGEHMKKMCDTIGDNLMMFHNNEIAAYEMFARVADAERPMPLAKYYGSRPVTDAERMDGYIIMEDLSAAAASADMSVGFDVAQAESLVDSLARLHAWSVRNGSAMKAAGLQADMEKLMEPMFDAMIQSFDAFVPWINEPARRDFFGPTCTSRVGELRPHMGQIVRFATAHREHGLPDVLVHGDFWANNILMRKEGGTEAAGSDIGAIVDWQIAHPGGPAEDLVRLLLMSCGSELRDKHTDALLQLYHARLRLHLGGADPPYTMAEMRRHYEQCYAVYGGMFVPFLTQTVAMIESGHFIKTTDPEKMKAKFMDDARSTILDCLRLKDKFANES